LKFRYFYWTKHSEINGKVIMEHGIIGWDVGGAHIKLAVVTPEGRVVQVIQQPCPLWKGLNYLQQQVEQIKQQLPVTHYCHVITMTGELVDLFNHRIQGVEQIIQQMKSALPGCKLKFFVGNQTFLSAEKIQPEHYLSIASVNWLATASWAANQLQQGLLLDIGSTTTDILVLANQQVQTIGLTDYERLASAELVYTGIVRTAVMAVAQTTYFEGQQIGLMAEYFATMADVYRLTGYLNEAHDQTETADGAEKTELASARRLARMIGCDFCQTELNRWRQFAFNLKDQQKHIIQSACRRQLSRHLISTQDYFIGAGIGRFLVKEIARDLGYPYLDFNDLVRCKMSDSAVNCADCAPAVAVALLAMQTVSLSE